MNVACVTIAGIGRVSFQHASNANAVVGVDMARISLVGAFGDV